MKAATTFASPSGDGPPRTPRWRLIAIMALVLAATLLAHAPSWNAGLVDFDDHSLLVDNTHYRGLGPDNLEWMFTTTHLGHYQPLTWLSFAIDHELLGARGTGAGTMEFPAGLDPRVFHRTSLVLHAINAVLVMLLLRALLARAARGASDARDWALAATGALAWSVHPLRVESVAWATERRDVLSTLFLLASTLAYLRSAPVDSSRTPAQSRWLWASLALLVLSLLSKAWGMSLFALLVILDVYPLRRLLIEPRRWLARERRSVILEKVPFALLGVAAAVVAGYAQKSAPGAVRTLAEWPITSRIAQAAYGLVVYLQKSLVPTDLVALVELPRNMNWLAPRYLVCYALVAMIGALAISLRRRAPSLACAFAAYAVLLLPVLGTLQSGDQFVADRYSYLAIIPVIALAVGAARALSTRMNAAGRWTLLALACGAIAVCASMSREQTRVWSSSVSLWQHAVDHGAPGSAVHVNLGLALQQAGRPDDAPPHFEQATRIAPSDGRAWYLLGRAYVTQKKYDDAERALRQAAQHMPQAYIAWVALGNLLFHELQQREQGIAAFREGVRDLTTTRTGSDATRKLSGLPYLALGTALKATGDVSGARAAFERALSYPDSAEQATRQLAALPAKP